MRDILMVHSPLTEPERAEASTRRAGPAAFYPWYVAGLMGCCYAVAFVDRALIGVAAAPIQWHLGLSDGQFGLLHGTAFVILYCLCGLPMGWLADRVDRRAMIALGILFWTAMTALCGLAGSFAMFFLARIGVGLGEASLVPAGMSLLGDTMPGNRMARAAALFLMGAAIGNAAALLAGGYLLTWLTETVPSSVPWIGTLAPWQALFVIGCLPGLVLAPLVMTIREPRRPPPAQMDRQGVAGALAHVRDHRGAYGFLAAATSCSVMLAQAQGAWMPLFYVRQFGLAPGASAMLVGTMFLASAPAGQLAGGFLTDRLQSLGIGGAQNLVLAICLLLSLAPASIFCLADRLGLSEAGYCLFNFLVSASTPSGLAGLQLLTPARYRGLLTALLVSIVTLVGVGLGPAVVGLLTDHLFGDEQALGRSLLLVIMAAGIAGPLLAAAGRRPFARTARLMSLAGCAAPHASPSAAYPDPASSARGSRQ